MDTYTRTTVAEAVAAYGYAVVVADGYAYTVGETTYVITGLSDVLMTQVLQRMMQGVQIFGEYDVKIVRADPATLELEYARLGTQVFQVLWPDVYGVFPDEDGYRGAEQMLFTEVANRN